MKTALITGVSGYLGSHLAKTLKQNNWRVVGLDIRHTTNQYVDLFHPCDVRETEAVEELFQKIEIDTVFHLAGRIEVSESVLDPIGFYNTNVCSTISLISLMNKYGVNNIIYSSTAGLYKTKNKPLTEDDEVEPKNNPYASSKYCAELAIKASKLNYVIFRYFNLAGADLDGEFGENHEPETHLIPRILQNLNNFKIYGTDYSTPDGTCIRDFVHVSDVAEAHVQAADYLSAGQKSQVFNLGTGQGYSVKEIVNRVVEVTGKPVFVTHDKRRAGDPPQLVADINFAKNILKYQPKYDIMTMIETANNWHKDDN